MLDDLFAARRNMLVYSVGLAALALVGAAAVAGFVGGRRTFVEAPANAGLTVDAARLDLGSVWARKDLVWKLPIHNPTEQLVRIVDLRSSCSCTAVAPRELTIPAGATQEVQLTLDVTPASGEASSAPSNGFRVLVAPYVAGGSAQEVGWEIHGEILNPFACEPSSPLAIDELVFGASRNAATVKLHGHRDFERVEAECDPALGSVRINTAGGRDYDLIYEPASELPLGPLEARLRVRASERSEQPPIEIEYVVHGNVLHPVEALPAGLTLGAQPVGETIEETVTLVPRGAGPLGAVAVELAPEGAQVDVSESTPERVILNVHQRIAAEGARIEPIHLRVQTADGKPLPPLEVNVAYVGVRGSPEVEATHSPVEAKESSR